MPTRAEHVEGGLIGLQVGDALGAFSNPAEPPPPELIEFTPPPDFARAHPGASGRIRAHQGTPTGAWSNDGAQALCLLDSLLACSRFDAEDLGRRLVRWYDEGYLAVDGHVFDIGIQIGLARLREGVPALEAGATGERALGSGSLVCVLPLALCQHDEDAELFADARAVASDAWACPGPGLLRALWSLGAAHAGRNARSVGGGAVEPAGALCRRRTRVRRTGMVDPAR
jgi:ADP-ribosylglycohydrolase